MSFASVLAFLAGASGMSIAGAVLLRRHPRVVHLAFAAALLTASAASLSHGFASQAGTLESVVHGHLRTDLLSAVTSGLWLLFSVCFARAEVPLGRSKWHVAAIAATLLPLGLRIAFADLYVVPTPGSAQSPLWTLRLGWPGMCAQVVTLGASVMALMNLERTYRASVGTMRWRIKFMLLAVGIVVLARLYTSSQALLFRALDPALEVVNSAALLVAVPMLLRSYFRAGQFDTYVYPSRVIIQNSITVLLAGIYLLVLAGFAQFAIFLGGEVAFAAKAFVVLVAIASLAMLLQSDRFRLALRRFVTRHFKRPTYDYEVVWKRFTEATSSRLEREDLARALTSLTADVFQTLSVNLWLLDDRKEVMAAAGSTAPMESKRVLTTIDETKILTEHFQRHADPVDFESANTQWAAILRRWHPSAFDRGGNRVAAPVIARGQLIGFFTVGDRVAGSPFTVEDTDMLKCIADHAAASVLNVQLSQQLLQAKELEAFQTMATFFVHDLKNAASTLNLMLQNLPTHYNDPEFRADALRGVGKTVAHINSLTSRLSSLRHELKLQLAECDLNEIVNKSTEGLDSTGDITLKKNFVPSVRTLGDREQLGKVVTNLVLNAREASSVGATVQIGTSVENGHVVLSVADTGCGMSAEFVGRSLFRPFQTTKKNGLGIGMFQSKMIIHAHGGRIGVTSEPGKGTTFKVYLPSLPASK